MVKASFTASNGERVAIVGLSLALLEQLRSGAAVKVDLYQCGVRGKVILMAGATDAAIIAALALQGVVVPS